MHDVDHVTSRFSGSSMSMVLKTGGHHVLVQIRYGTSVDTVEVFDHQNGTFQIAHQTTHAGSYSLSVTVDSMMLDIGGSAKFAVLPSVIDPAATLVEGLNARHFRAGSVGRFIVTAADAHHNRLTTGAQQFAVGMRSEKDTDVEVQVNDNKDGSYEAIFTATVAGKHFVAVRLGDAELPHSPFDMDVLSARVLFSIGPSAAC